MNRLALSFLNLTLTATAVAQIPAVAQPTPVATNSVTESSHVSRFVAGPGERPQAFMLRNGTFVMLSPSLAQQLPATLRKGTSLRVSGDEYRYGGNKTVQARSITIGGVSYIDNAPAGAPLGVQVAGIPGVPPPPLAGPGAPPPPAGVGAPPPPPPLRGPRGPHPPLPPAGGPGGPPPPPVGSAAIPPVPGAAGPGGATPGAVPPSAPPAGSTPPPPADPPANP